MIYEAVAVFLYVGKSTEPWYPPPWTRSCAYSGFFLEPYRTGGRLLIIYYVYNRTIIGFNVRAIGGNTAVARALGVNVTSTLLWVGLICGCSSGRLHFCRKAIPQTTVKTGFQAYF
jgi:branched-subunit amino acid ABC-type transport system permease component